MISMLLLAGLAQAETLDVKLTGKTGAVRVPSEKLLAVTIKGAAETDKASWTSVESDALSLQCGEPKAAEDKFVDQLLLAVGESKWALVPGASVKLTCADGPVSFADIHGTKVASFKGPVLVTVESLKSKSAR